MKRRAALAAVLALIGGATARRVLSASGRKEALPVIGFLRSASLTDAKHITTAFQQGLRQAGFVDGQNVRIEYRSADSRHERLPSIAQELIALPVDLIVANHIAALPRRRLRQRFPLSSRRAAIR